MQELITILNISTSYTSGTLSPADLLSLACENGIDVVITADRNLLVQGLDGYTQSKNRQCLLLAAEQVYDRCQLPPRNSLLVIGTERELAPQAAKPRQLKQVAQKDGGLVFAAHPFAAEKTSLGELLPPWKPDTIPEGVDGLEIWNSFSELQGRARGKFMALILSWLPALGLRGPHPQACRFWDERLTTGANMTAIAGSGLGALPKNNSRLQRALLKSITNHLIVPRPLSGELEKDRRMVLEALRKGSAFIARDDLAPASGFRFYAQGREAKGEIGDTIILKDSVTFQIRLPQAAACLLYQNGEVIRTWQDKDLCVHTSTQPGAYRVEAQLPFLAQEMTWIVSNPIYVRPYIPPALRDQLYETY